MDLAVILQKIALIYVPFLFALCFHEFAHGWVARRRGDHTAEMMGRLTMNPVAHMDLIGTLILPMISIISGLNIFFGWAKPVPVNSRNLKNPRIDMFWIAIAGPLSNVLLAVVGAGLMGILVRVMGDSSLIVTLVRLLDAFILTNLFLAIFNMIPLHPLDGGKVLARFLPAEVNYKLEQNEMMTSMILLVLIMVGALKFLAVPVYALHGLLRGLAL
jgi:Zn-dependent protease